MKDTEGWNYLNQEAFQIEPADDLDLTKDVRIIEWQNGWAIFLGNMLLCETTSYHQAITLKWIMERLQRDVTLAEVEMRSAKADRQRTLDKLRAATADSKTPVNTADIPPS